MRYCKKCVIPDTRPGIKFDENGVCYPCLSAEKKKKIDWKSRQKELDNLVKKYKRTDGRYDCVIPVSGGKDSTYQIHIMKDIYDMNPLLVSVVDSYSTTKMGTKNLVNSNEAFGCDLMTFSFKRNVDRQMTRLAFENFGSPSWPNDLAIYSIPLRVAYQFNIPLIVYGENVAYEYGGPFAKETYSAKEQIKNDVVKPIDWDWWYNHGINSEDVESIKYPPAEIVDKLEPIYLSYFYRWDGYHNYQVASRYGFKPVTHEWKRQGRLTDYYGVDAVGYHVHPWMKYPKYGHARATDVSNDWIRNGYITRNEAIELVRKYDHILDHKMLDDFLSYCGYTDREFWDIVEKFWNKDIFEKIEEVWRLKDPIYGKRTEHAPLPEIITPA